MQKRDVFMRMHGEKSGQGTKLALAKRCARRTWKHGGEGAQHISRLCSSLGNGGVGMGTKVSIALILENGEPIHVVGLRSPDGPNRVDEVVARHLGLPNSFD